MDIIKRFLFISSLFSLMSFQDVMGQLMDPMNNIVVKGSVFFDANENSKREESEIGIGGIELITNQGQKIICDNEGNFEFSLKKTDRFYELTLVRDTLPAGFHFTTPSTQFIGTNQQNFQEYNFGIHYPLKTKVLKVDENNSQFHQNNINIGKIVFSLKNREFKINQDTLFSYSRVEGSLKNERKILPLNEINFSFDEKRLNDFIDYINKKIESKILENVQVEITLPAKMIRNHKPFDLVKNKIEKQILNRIKESEKRTFFHYKLGKSQLKLTIKYGKPSLNICRLYDDNLSYTLNKFENMELMIEGNKENHYQIDCPGFSKRFTIKAQDGEYIVDLGDKKIVRELQSWKNVKKGKESESKTTGKLFFKSSKYIKFNRDLVTHFSFETENLREVFINGKEFKKLDKEMNYIHKSKVGDNYLNITLTDKKNRQAYHRYHFDLFRQKKFYFATFIDNYNLKSKSSKFDFNYNIPSTNRSNSQLQYFVSAKWGLNFHYIKDIEYPNVELAGGETAHANRTTTSGHVIYRYRFAKNSFYSALLQLYGGYIQKKVNLPTSALIHFAKDYTGISFGAELLKEHFFIEDMDTSTQLFYSSSSSDHLFRFTQEFRLNLNRVGRWLESESYDQIYERRYHYWNNLRLIFGVNVEQDRRSAKNADAYVVDDIIAYRVGFSYQY